MREQKEGLLSFRTPFQNRQNKGECKPKQGVQKRGIQKNKGYTTSKGNSPKTKGYNGSLFSSTSGFLRSSPRPGADIRGFPLKAGEGLLVLGVGAKCWAGSEVGEVGSIQRALKQGG